jgi:hypothetical protein
MCRGELDLARIFRLAALAAFFAAIPEIAVVRHVDGVWYRARDAIEPFLFATDHGL